MKISYLSCLFILSLVYQAKFCQAQTTQNGSKSKTRQKALEIEGSKIVIVDAFYNLVVDSNKRTACSIEYLDDLPIDGSKSASGKAYLIKKGTIAETGITNIEKNGDCFKLISSKMVIGRNISDKVINGIRQPEIHYSNFNITFLEKTGITALALYNDGALAVNISNLKSYKVPNITGRWQNKYCIEFDANGSRVRINFFKAKLINDK